MSDVDFKQIPKELWAQSLAHALLKYFEPQPTALFALVDAGQKKFVKDGLNSDKFGLGADHYRQCFKILRKRAWALGLPKKRA